MIIFSEAALWRAAKNFLEHYHRERNHQGLDNGLIAPLEHEPSSIGPVECRQRFGGLLSFTAGAPHDARLNNGTVRAYAFARYRPEVSVFWGPSIGEFDFFPCLLLEDLQILGERKKPDCFAVFFDLGLVLQGQYNRLAGRV